MGSGIIIRLIDVVFILLFGFIAVSRLSEGSLIELPKTTEIPAVNPDPESIVIVGVRRDGLYLLEDEKYSVSTPAELHGYLSSQLAGLQTVNARMRVRIRASFDAPIKYIMSAADLCDQLGIPKGIDIQRRSAK